MPLQSLAQFIGVRFAHGIWGAPAPFNWNSLCSWHMGRACLIYHISAYVSDQPSDQRGAITIVNAGKNAGFLKKNELK